MPLIDRRGQPYRHLLAHHGPPRHEEPIDPPIPARATARCYDGQTRTVEGLVTARAGRLLALSATYPEWGQWTAWLDRGCVERL